MAKAPDLEAAAAVVRAAGLRLSTSRRLVLEALYRADEPLTAEQIAGSMDVASVYRNLEALEAIRREFGYEARFTHFPIAGLCPDCRKA